MSEDVPKLVEFSKIGQSEMGFLTVVEGGTLPFSIRRVYWTYNVPETVVRGNHAHHALMQLIFAVNGRIKMTLESLAGVRQEFILDTPHVGLFIPKLYWRTIEMSADAVLLCLASAEYSAFDYIGTYEDFLQLRKEVSSK